MIGLSAAGAASASAHLVHLGIVVAGVLGLAAILLPHVVQRAATPAAGRSTSRPTGRPTSRPTGRPPSRSGVPVGLPDEVARRLALLRAAQDRRPASRPLPGSLWLPLAATGSTVAAGVHAALVPPHLDSLPWLATAFSACAAAQLAWAAALLTAPGPRVLLLGIAGHAGVVVLWALSRTVGLPPLLPQAEPVGAWDLLSVAAQLAAVAAGAAVLTSRTAPRRQGLRDRTRTAHWLEWHPAAHVATLLGVGTLALIALGGVGAGAGGGVG